MSRGTTKPITCTVDRDFTNYPVVELTLTDGHYKLTFNKSELTITPSTVVVSLTQEQAQARGGQVRRPHERGRHGLGTDLRGGKDGNHPGL